ncbi:MAG: sulfotransferase [Deltaproteobacteria bacterium]|nr:sulfotransferase [Deltaproteobacteria bacterium]MBW2362080.1 sulfotransferase [Deltaproteobacteria bacterium]
MPPDAIAPDHPIFVFGSGWRCGSTLVQRLLCSHPDVRVWGESRDLVEHLMHGWETVEGLQTLSSKNQENLEREGHQGWIAVLNPGFDHFERGMRELLRRYLAEPARAEGRPRWGFKEVRCDAAAARWLAHLFPEARFLFLVRHPQDCVASARGTTHENRGLMPEVGGPEAFVAHWTRVTRSFRDAHDVAHLTVVYEQLIEKPREAADDIACFLDLDPSGFDLGVFDNKVRGWKREPRLELADWKALRDPALWEVAEPYGYTRRPEPGLLERYFGGGRRPPGRARRTP